MNTITAYIEIIRPVNSVMNGIAVIVGYIIACGCLSINMNIILGFLVGFFLTASSMVINDYFDRHIDAINAPQRPIPSGRINERTAKIYGVLLGIIGLIVALYLGIIFFTIASISYTISLLYNWRMKKTGFIGNLMVSYCVAVPFIYGALLAPMKDLTSAAIFALIAFLANTGREITKGIVDVVGDSSRGIKTVAVKYGSSHAAIIAALFYIIAVILSIIPLYEGLVNILYTPLIIVTDIGILLNTAKILKSPTRENAYKVKNRILIFMMVGLLAFTIGRLPLAFKIF